MRTKKYFQSFPLKEHPQDPTPKEGSLGSIDGKVYFEQLGCVILVLLFKYKNRVCSYKKVSSQICS